MGHTTAYVHTVLRCSVGGDGACMRQLLVHAAHNDLQSCLFLKCIYMLNFSRSVVTSTRNAKKCEQ